MPRLNGLEAIHSIRELPFPVKVIILTMYKERRYVQCRNGFGVENLCSKRERRERHNGGTGEDRSVDEGFGSALMLKAGQRRSDRSARITFEQTAD